MSDGERRVGIHERIVVSSLETSSVRNSSVRNSSVKKLMPFSPMSGHLLASLLIKLSTTWVFLLEHGNRPFPGQVAFLFPLQPVAWQMKNQSENAVAKREGIFVSCFTLPLLASYLYDSATSSPVFHSLHRFVIMAKKAYHTFFILSVLFYVQKSLKSSLHEAYLSVQYRGMNFMIIGA